MSDTVADLIDALSADHHVTIELGDRIFGGIIPRGADFPHAWLQRRQSSPLDVLDPGDEGRPYREIVDLEIVTLDGAEAVAIGEYCRTALDGLSGRIGNGVYTAVSVGTATDSYAIRNQDAGEYLYVTSLEVEVLLP